VEIRLVRAADEIGHHGDARSTMSGSSFANADRPEVPGIAPGRGDDLGFGRPAELREPGDLADLDLVHA
jgi:hypothetical protein